MPTNSIGRGLVFTLHGLMFLSGALALVYEVLWLRRFSVVFGATTTAMAATLTAVFLGLAVGSGRFGPRYAGQRPLLAYGLWELGVALTAGLVEPLLSAYDRVYPALHAALGSHPVAFLGVKFALTIVALFPPTLCMGATVPVLAQALAIEKARTGVVGSGLYAANTLGAALGAISVPLFWLPELGASTAQQVCLGLSGLVGLAASALGLRRRSAPAGETPGSGTRATPAKPASPTRSGATVAALAGLSGGLTFVLQVTWARMFAQVHENSLTSFAMVVSVFILALAAGAGVAHTWLRRARPVHSLLAWAWVGGGLMVFLSPLLFYRLTGGLAFLPGPEASSMVHGRLLSLALIVVFLPTALAGMVLPLLMELAGRMQRGSAGQALGFLLAVNTAGAVTGLLAATFILPAWLGLWATLGGVGGLMVAIGILGSVTGRLRQPLLWVAAAVVVGTIILANPASLPRTRVRADQGERLLDLQEGAHGIVATVERRGNRRLKLDNSYVLGGTASVGDERMQAHLPLLLHPAPQRVAFLGLGTGISSGGALLHPAGRLTVLEIVPEVAAAAKLHFSTANLRLLDDPRVTLTVDDARSFLRGRPEPFDVIVGDLVVPWRRGEASLYAAEHFAEVRRSLAPGGLFCQWLPLFQLSEEQFRIVAATFLDVFPRATLWRGDFSPDQPALALIGHAGDDAVLDPLQVARRWREMRPDPTNPHLRHVAGAWMFLIGPLDAAAPEFSGAKRHREDRPWLEILGGRSSAGAFIGRPLARWLETVRQRPTRGSPLDKLAASELRWRDAGGIIAEASLLMAAGKKAEADLRLQEAAADLPEEVRKALLPAAAPPSPGP